MKCQTPNVDTSSDKKQESIQLAGITLCGPQITAVIFPLTGYLTVTLLLSEQCTVSGLVQ